jgi:hypothetical protein
MATNRRESLASAVLSGGGPLSENLVRNHVSAILVKLQVPDRASAVAKARDAGLGTNSRRTMEPS